MRKAFFSLLVAALVCFVAGQYASATDRVTVYPGQNPDTVQTNQAWRYQRLGDGTVLRDILGALGVSGAWSDINVVGTSGLNVVVQPSSSPPGEAGMVYQVLKDDPSPVPYTCPTGFPCSGYQLLADSTQIVIPAIVNQTSAAIGPLPCQGCTSGQATSYLIETQIQTAPGNNRSMMFVSSSGSVSFPNVNTEVDDNVAYAFVQGGTATWSTASPNPTPPMPSPAAGWVPLAYIQVVHGATNCATPNSCYITMNEGTQFQAGAFGTVQFGGPYAQDGNISPSKLTTHYQIGECGFSPPPGGTGAGGYSIENPSATTNNGKLLAGDLSGNSSVCGQALTIFDQQSNTNPAEIIVNTPVDSGTSKVDILYPAASTHSGGSGWVISGTCSTNTYCTPVSGNFICQGGGAGTPNSAMVSWTSNAVVLYNLETISGGGLSINLYNAGGSGLSGTLPYTYVCL